MYWIRFLLKTLNTNYVLEGAYMSYGDFDEYDASQIESILSRI